MDPGVDGPALWDHLIAAGADDGIRACSQLSMNIRRRPERGSVWRIAPPLTVTHDEIDRAVTILDQALTESLDKVSRKGLPD